KIKPPSTLYFQGLKAVSINTFCPITLLLHIPFSLTIINIFLMHQKSRIRCTGILNLSSYPAFVPLNSSPFDARIYI
ncbi:hypothetical protein AAA074_11355, partial [Coprococcus comes]|uniref:hypothetical protein n=1 Tax=Coprococcus comes TaxID=410072 RepID=UPI0032BF4BEA